MTDIPKTNVRLDLMSLPGSETANSFARYFFSDAIDLSFFTYTRLLLPIHVCPVALFFS